MKKSKRRRTISLSYSIDHEITIHIPYSLKAVDYNAILTDKTRWIRKQYDRVSGLPPSKTFKTGDVFYYLDEPKVLRILLETRHDLKLELSGRYIDVKVPIETRDRYTPRDLRKHLVSFYNHLAHDIFEDRLFVWSQMMELAPNRLRLRAMSSRWGSCSSSGDICLNVFLVGAPIWVIDYVIVHELAHLQHMNHSKQFWQFVERFYDNPKKATRWLRDNQSKIWF